jgi:hypothetical protein
VAFDDAGAELAARGVVQGVDEAHRRVPFFVGFAEDAAGLAADAAARRVHSIVNGSPA